MKHPLRWLAAGIGLVVVAFAVVLAVQDDGPRQTGGRLLGQEMPAFDLPTLDGGRVTSEDLAGKTVVVNFWNSWCIPCRQEEDELAAFYERHRDDGDVALLGVVRDDTEQAAREYAEQAGLGWTVALDPEQQAALDFGTTGQPETFVVAPDGLVTGVQLGPTSLGQLEQMLEEARTGAPSAP